MRHLKNLYARFDAIDPYKFEEMMIRGGLWFIGIFGSIVFFCMVLHIMMINLW